MIAMFLMREKMQGNILSIPKTYQELSVFLSESSAAEGNPDWKMIRGFLDKKQATLEGIIKVLHRLKMDKTKVVY